MDRPFREIHELYKILYERAEAQQKAEEERKKEEENNKKANPNEKPPDARTNTIEPSPMEAEMLEDALEELT